MSSLDEYHVVSNSELVDVSKTILPNKSAYLKKIPSLSSKVFEEDKVQNSIIDTDGKYPTTKQQFKKSKTKTFPSDGSFLL